MKRALKILGAVLGGLVGFVLLVAAVLVYVVFTPKQLTPVVDKVAGEYLTCDYEIGEVDLTFFSTFPEFGLRADGLLIVNPTEGAQSDTLLEAKRVVARIELMDLLRNGNINVREVALQEVTLNPYIGEEGQTNFDIVALSPDSTEEDTTSSSFIKSISFEDLHVLLQANQITFVDKQDTLSASLHDAEIALSAKEEDEQVKGELRLSLPDLSASYQGTDYATDAKIVLKAPYAMDLRMEGLSDIQHAAVTLSDAHLAVNEFKVDIEGKAQVIPTIDVDMRLATNKWHIADFLQLVPPSIFTMPEDITADGYLRLDAVVKGAYNDSTMPLVDAHLVLSDATGEYAGLPYVLEDVQAIVDAHVDLNNEALTAADIRSFSAKTKQSSVTGSGRVEDLLNSMLLDLALNVKLHLPDAAYFLPDDMVVSGKAEGPLFLKITLDDLSEVRLKKGIIKGDFAIRDLDAAMDSMTVSAKKAQLSFNIPNTRKAAAGNKQAAARRKHLDLLDGCLRLSNVEFEQIGSMEAHLGETDIDLQVSDILSDDPVIYADLDVTSSQLDGKMLMTDSAGTQTAVVQAGQPALTAYVEYDTKDTLGIPTLACTFKMQRLVADYDTIHARITAPSGEAAISGGRRDKTQPRIKAKIKADDVDAKMGSEVAVQTGLFDVAIAARHTNNTENILLEWQPKLDFHLKKTQAELAMLEPTVKIPEIKFSYSNKDFKIDTSRVELGHSDFSLSGEIRNIGAYLENKDILEGTLNFYSSHADINELMGYVSGLGSDEEALAEEEKTLTPEEKEADPFLVPVGIDMTLNTYIQEADAFDQHLRNLGGQVYVRDGVLIIEEMGFICEAAKLQLTGMYKTPRKNHIFAGFDYHMTDINVEELVNMIPQVDSMLPMLRSFKGAANFHLAAETYLNANYEIKPSTTRGAMSIDAKDLTLLDGETFTKIAKILTFNKKTENKIDSISAEITLYKQQVDIYPFLITCDKWMGAVGGQHYLDMSFDYHVNLLAPLYIGVGVKGTFDDLSIKPEKCIYAKDFRPVLSKKVDTQAADIRRMVKQALEKNMNK